MSKYPWEDLHRLIKSIAKMDIGAGGTVSVTSVPVFKQIPWIDFLNIELDNNRSLWLLYEQFTEYIEDLRKSLTEKGYDCGKYISGIILLSKADFLRLYTLEKDATTLQKRMMGFIDADRIDILEEIQKDESSAVRQAFTEGTDVPLPPSELRITQVGVESSRLQIDILEADHPKLWLSVILGNMISSCKGGRITAKGCLAPDCPKFFLPAPRSHGQLYHSTTCRSRHNMQKRSKSTS